MKYICNEQALQEVYLHWASYNAFSRLGIGQDTQKKQICVVWKNDTIFGKTSLI